METHHLQLLIVPSWSAGPVSTEWPTGEHGEPVAQGRGGGQQSSVPGTAALDRTCSAPVNQSSRPPHSGSALHLREETHRMEARVP